VNIGGYVVLTLKFNKEGRRWTACCEELGTATFGRSLKEAQEKILEAVLLDLETLEEIGERERFFKEHNIQLHRTKPGKDALIPVTADKGVFFQPLIQPLPQKAGKEKVPA
jgi:predicted RNase H-like HicB family nuclease